MDLTYKVIKLFPAVLENKNLLLILSLFLIIIGFFMLMKGADVFVDGASKIAEKAKIPLIVIGLTVVAFGTSAPEAAVSITSALKDNSGISIGNVIGSNILNIMLILGITSLIAKLKVKKNTIKYEVPFLTVITIVLLLLGNLGADINFLDGIILLVFFGIFIFYLMRLSKVKDESLTEEVSALSEKDTILKMVLFIIFGLIIIIIGSDMTVYAATNIATAFGVSDRIIGLTIVAFGTSLPELVTNISAVRKGKDDIAVGNIIGSNIFNILAVLGISGVVSKNGIPFSSQFMIDTIVAIGAVILFGVLVYKRKELGKIGGVVLLTLYAVYMGYVFVN